MPASPRTPARHPGDGSRRSWLLLVIVGSVLVGGLGVTAGLAPAVTARAEPTLDVVGGVRGFHDAGDHVMIVAIIESDEFFEGRLEALSPSGAVSVRDVDVAGGTTKQVRIIAATSLGVDSNDIDVRLVDDNGDLAAQRSITMRTSSSVELVGVLPSLATRVGDVPEKVTLASGTGRAELVALTADDFALGSAGLDVYDTLVAASSDVNSLTAQGTQALLGWLNRGGRLVLDDAGSLDALPPAWRPGPSAMAWAGRGEVTVREGEASRGRWAALIEPTGPTTRDTLSFGFGDVGGFSIERELAERAGVRLPELTPLLIPLVVYWLTVSVVVFLVLRSMKRLTLAWIALPVIAVVTATAIGVYGNSWRAAGQPTSSTFVDGYPSGATAQLTAMTFSRRGGTASIELPELWIADSEANPTFAPSAPLRTAMGGTATTFATSLEPGQVTTATFIGPSAPVDLVVEAAMDEAGDNVIGTVRNDGATTLSDVAVFAPGGGESIGNLGPGEQADFSIDADPLPSGVALDVRVWDRKFDDDGFPVAADDSLVEFGVWEIASTTTNLYPTGMVRAAGWTDERTGDAEGLRSRTVVSTTAPIRVTNGELHPATVRATRVRDPFGQFGDFSSPVVMRFMLPPDQLSAVPLVVETPVGITEIEFWNGANWIEAPLTRRIATVPAAAVRGNAVLMRLPLEDGFFAGDPSTNPELRAATPAERGQ